MKTVIVYGPKACGKTTNAETLAKHFGLSQIIELDENAQAVGGPRIPAEGALVLTFRDRQAVENLAWVLGVRAEPFERAIGQARTSWAEEVYRSATWAVLPLNDRLHRFAIVRDSDPGPGKSLVCTHVRSQSEASLLAAAPALLRALKNLLADYQALSDSGDAGALNLEKSAEGLAAYAAIELATRR